MIEITVDLETTCNGGHNSSPEAHYPNNKVLLCGWSVGAISPATEDDVESLCDYIEEALDDDEDIRLIGHNLKFDLKYLIRERPLISWHKVDYWCTMYYEYRDAGHRFKFSSLEDTATRRGLTFKKSLDLGALLASGLKMEDIPLDDLRSYLRDDVRITRKVYHAQWQPSQEVFQQHMLALAHMELLGLPLDVPLAQSQMKALVRNEDTLEQTLRLAVQDKLEWSDGTPLGDEDLKWTAPRTVSYILTGEPKAGLTKRVRKNIVWKKGEYPVLTSSEIIRIWGTTVPTHLGYPLPKGALAKLGKIRTGYVNDLLEYRRIHKLLGTYYGPFLEEAQIQPTIHPKMNMCQTATGRLSSSKPNGQNMPEEVRKLFLSENSSFMEIDFKQLEVVALAMLSKDKQLILDIQNGEDIHFNTGKSVMGWKTLSDMNDKDRKIVKGVNFGLIYGGGAKGLALTTGQPVKLIKDLIKAFYKRYPGVKDWQESFYTQMTQALRPSGFERGEQVYESLVTEPVSQRKFYFREGTAPTWVRKKTGRRFSFKPTESKNYPVQGFAGGDIVMEALALLYEALVPMVETEIRMTVHDSILVDACMWESTLRDIMEKVCKQIKDKYNLPFNLDFDITSGSYWQ